jgi:hypothetical protein
VQQELRTSGHAGGTEFVFEAPLLDYFGEAGAQRLRKHNVIQTIDWAHRHQGAGQRRVGRRELGQIGDLALIAVGERPAQSAGDARVTLPCLSVGDLFP